MQNNKSRYVYYMEKEQLRNIINKSYLHNKYDILSEDEKAVLRESVIKQCANRYYNERRIRYFVMYAFKSIQVDYNIESLVEILIIHMLNTDYSIGYFTMEEYNNLLVYEFKHNNAVNIQRENSEHPKACSTCCICIRSN